MVYAVIDTNVLVSALFSVHSDSATVIIIDKVSDGTIVPLYNSEIFEEYRDVLSRPKFKFPSDLVTGNIKHFSDNPIVVTPAELLEILNAES